MALYKLKNDFKGDLSGIIKNLGTVGTSRYEIYIPIAPDNTDYQEYLAWVDAGNTPEAAD